MQMQTLEIPLTDLNVEEFIEQQTKAIGEAAGDGLAVNALSGGVDSSVVTLLGHRALGARLKTYFIENGLMRQGEPQHIADVFRDLGVEVEIVDARGEVRRRMTRS